MLEAILVRMLNQRLVVSVIYPIETLKTRVMSSTGGAHKGNSLIIRTAADMWRTGGIRLYFRGLPAGLIGVFPYSAIDMSTFEGIKLAYTKWAGEEPGIPGSLAFGALSGGIGATSESLCFFLLVQ